MYARADTSGAFGIGAGSARAPSSVVIERKQKSPSRTVDERNIPRDPPKLPPRSLSAGAPVGAARLRRAPGEVSDLEGGDSNEIAASAPDTLLMNTAAFYQPGSRGQRERQ